MATYACSEIANGVCTTWVEITLSTASEAFTPENGAQAFALGFGIVFVSWVVGFAVSSVLKLIKML